MRVQKSVYYMTDRELRIYKRQLRRRRQMQRRIVTMLATICVIAFCAVSYHGIRSLASSGEDQLKFKYYTQVTVAYGETLWDLSDDYIDYDEYKDKKEYIAEVQSINHLTEEDHQTGCITKNIRSLTSGHRLPGASIIFQNILPPDP